MSGGYCPVCRAGRFRDDSRFRDHLVTAHDWTFDDVYEHWEAEDRRAKLAQLYTGRSHMREWTLDTFPADDVPGRRALNAALAWYGAWVEVGGIPQARAYLYGPPGGGKTGLALGLSRRWIEEPDDGGSVEFHNVRALLAAQRARFAGGGRDDDDPSAVERLLDLGGGDATTLVVLDDLGAERPTEYALETVALLVEHLHAEDVPLVVTTNYGPGELAKRLGQADRVVGQRVVSRLIEDALRLKLDRPDLRARPARASEAV